MPSCTVSPALKLVLPACVFAFGLASAELSMVRPGSASPLDKEACDGLTQALQNLKALDVAKLMENGPAWAVTHLSPTDLDLIRRYIHTDEQMRFRCTPASALVQLKHLDEAEDDGAHTAQETVSKKADRSKAQSSTQASPPPSAKKPSKSAHTQQPAAPVAAGDKN